MAVGDEELVEIRVVRDRRHVGDWGMDEGIGEWGVAVLVGLLLGRYKSGEVWRGSWWCNPGGVGPADIRPSDY